MAAETYHKLQDDFFHPEDLLKKVGTDRDREAFVRLFNHYAPRVKSWLMKNGATPAQAEDIVQNTFVTVWEKAAGYNPARAAASTWIFTIARNKRIDALRKDRFVPYGEDGEVPEPAGESPDDIYADTASVERLNAAIGTLPGEQAELLRMAFFEEKSHGQIARETRLPLGTVKSRLRLALEKLRQLMKGKRDMTDALDTLLIHYAAGRLDAAEALMVTALVAMNPAARARVARYEAFGGRVIEDEKPEAVHAACLASVMAKISCAPAQAPARPAPVPALPEPLRALLGGSCGVRAGAWGRAPGGMRRLSLRVPASLRKNVFLMQLAPGAAAAPHSHHGRELTLVIEGGYSDAFGRYRRGDIAVIDGDFIVHSPVADADGCLCLILAEGPLRFANPMQRMMEIFWRGFFILLIAPEAAGLVGDVAAVFV